MQKRIDELHEKDSLSLVEEQELKNLEQSVRYIKEKSELLESQKRKEAQELAKSNTETFNDEFGSYETKLKQEFDRLLADSTIAMYSDDWYEWTNKLSNLDKEIAESQIAAERLKRTWLDWRFEGLEKALDQLKQLDGELSVVLDLIGNAETLEENGSLTNAGKTKAALYSQQLAGAKQAASEYAQAMKALNELLKNGAITQEQ